MLFDVTEIKETLEKETGGFEGNEISHSWPNPRKSEILGSRGLKFNVEVKKRHS